MTRIKNGAIATGHIKTSEAGKCILEAGGNAFDAILASFFTACVCESSLTSLGGGGFLLAHDVSKGNSIVYDFFAQTPKNKVDDNIEFYPIVGDFGGATQEFHIGMGSIATPGTFHGVFKIYHELCSIPLKIIMEPAIKLAREGIELNGFSHFVLSNIVNSIFMSTKESRKIYQSNIYKDAPLGEGEILYQKDMADTFELLEREGERAFTEGDIIINLAKDSINGGGYLREEDLRDYKVVKRKPIEFYYRGYKFLTNPPPSAGGILISHMLQTLDAFNFGDIDYLSANHIELLSRTIEQTNNIRRNMIDNLIHEEDVLDLVFSRNTFSKSYENVNGKVNKLGGTTHMSVIDSDGNVASMTVTNGEGSGYIIPGTGIMLNNMLGEEDLNPLGFHEWNENQRISSMMSPSMLFHGEQVIALGSAGSNRIRSAIVQTVINIVDFKKEINDAVNNPRIHFENDKLDIEPGISEKEINKLKNIFLNINLWDKQNLFFGGVNCVGFDKKINSFFGAGDNRREGKYLLCVQ